MDELIFAKYPKLAQSEGFGNCNNLSSESEGLWVKLPYEYLSSVSCANLRDL